MSIFEKKFSFWEKVPFWQQGWSFNTVKHHGSTVWRVTVRPMFGVSRSNVGSQHVIGFISTVYFRFISDFLLFLSKYFVLIPIVFHNKCSTPNRLNIWLSMNSVYSPISYAAYISWKFIFGHLAGRYGYES